MVNFIKKINFKEYKKNKGFLILFAIVLSSIILAIAIAVTTFSYNKIVLTSSAKKSSDAFYAANLGVECALFYDLPTSGSIFGTPSGANVDCTGNNFNISTPSGGPWEIVLTNLGESGNACAKVNVSRDGEDTIIVSRGYDTAGLSTDCNPPSLIRTERLIEVRAGAIAGAGPNVSDSILVNVVNQAPSFGGVTSSDGQINCGSTCYGVYAPDTTGVILTANPNNGYLVEWQTGPCAGSTNSSCDLGILTASMDVSVLFSLDTNVVTRQLTVHKVGTYISPSNPSWGSVFSSPSGINCGTSPVCNSQTYSFPEGTNIDLTLVPILDYYAGGWTSQPGDVLGNASVCNNSYENTCNFDLNTDSTIRGWFGKRLTVSNNPSTGGTITGIYGLINCGSLCQVVLPPGYGSQITASPAGGYVFSHWSGDLCDGSDNPVCASINFNNNDNIVANYTLSGTPMYGTLTPDTLSCTIPLGGSNCSVNFDWSVTNPQVVGGSQVTSDTNNSGASSPGFVVATGDSGTNVPFVIPYGGRVFYLYNNGVLLDTVDTSPTGTDPITTTCASGSTWNGTTCALPGFTLAVNKNGTGVGTVTSAPSGINCGIDCSESYSSGSSITLTASTNASNVFVDWVGCDMEAANQCTINLNSDRTPTATFNALTGFPDVRSSAAILAITKTTRANSHTIFTSLMSGHQAGDLVIAFVSYDLDSYIPGNVSWTSGWTPLSINPPRNNGSTVNLLEVRYKIVSANEPDFVINTTSNSVLNALFVPVYNFNTSFNPASAVFPDTSATPDSPNLSSPGGTLSQNLWFSVASIDNDLTSYVTKPTGYDLIGNLATPSFGLSGSRLLVSTRLLNALSENPLSYTMGSSDNWIAITAVVKGQ